MEPGVVAAISRRQSTLAVRCGDGQFTLVRFGEHWIPEVGESVQGEWTRRGWSDVLAGDGTAQPVEIQSFNCSAVFARERLSL